MRWGTPAEYAYLYHSALSDEYRGQLLAWLEHHNEPLWQLVKKELQRERRKRSSDPPKGQHARQVGNE